MLKKTEQVINGATLKMTCPFAPEQYDVYMGEKRIGYLRLRHGYFSVRYPDANGENVYESTDSEGDGEFVNSERRKFLTKAVDVLLSHYYEDDANCDYGDLLTRHQLQNEEQLIDLLDRFPNCDTYDREFIADCYDEYIAFLVNKLKGAQG